jgi:hypothetical protein
MLLGVDIDMDVIQMALRPHECRVGARVGIFASTVCAYASVAPKEKLTPKATIDV